jgi:hypothetical protein
LNTRVKARTKVSAISEWAHVDARQILAQRNFVAECRRQQMGIGVASDIAQQRLVIDVAALVDVEAGQIGQSHRQHAGPQREIAGLPGGEVRRIGQRHQEIGA